MAVLAERLKEGKERKEIIPPNQTGFRMGMGSIDNIYVINYLTNRQLGRKAGMLVALFVDLKATFDLVNRRALIEAIRGRGIRKRLIGRVEEMIRDKKSRVRVWERGENF